MVKQVIVERSEYLRNAVRCSFSDSVSSPIEPEATFGSLLTVSDWDRQRADFDGPDGDGVVSEC